MRNLGVTQCPLCSLPQPLYPGSLAQGLRACFLSTKSANLWISVGTVVPAIPLTSLATSHPRTCLCASIIYSPTCWPPPGSWGNHCEMHLVASALHFTSPGASPWHSGGVQAALGALRPCPDERSSLGPFPRPPQPWRVMLRISDTPHPLRPCTLLPRPPHAHSPWPGQFLPILCDFVCKPSCPRS